jgi:hypothetical protein
MSKIYHYAFKHEYSGLSQGLITETEIISVSGVETKKIKVNALWDTGAMRSAVIPAVARNLNLIPIDRVKVKVINYTSIADLVKISIVLPNLITVSNINAAVCTLINGIDMLIGMDIITLGDLAISNSKGKTLFSFAIPPFEEGVDLYERAIEINNQK